MLALSLVVAYHPNHTVIFCLFVSWPQILGDVVAVSIGNDHRIVGAASINLGTSPGQFTPTRIVIHYTAGSTLSGAVSTLAGDGNSYNVLIDVDGSYHQARPFNMRSGHAGRSNWKASGGLTNASTLNTTSIGISMVNLGQFGYFSGGRWFWGWSGGAGSGPSILDANANKHSLIYRPSRPTHWEPYSRPQLPACKDLVAALVERYPSIIEIVGHHDIAIGHKADPGPLCPLEEWRQEFGKQGPLGLSAKVGSPDGELNLRDLPNASDGRILQALRNGHEVFIRSVTYVGASRGLVPATSGRALSGWASVDIDGSNRHAGFVYMKYLDETPLEAGYAARL